MRMGEKIRILALALAFLMSANAAQAAVDLHAVADAVDRHYNSLHSLSAAFTESFRGGGLARTESGRVWMKKPGKMRWEYQSPVQKLFLTDGKQAWFYVPEERQARRAAVKKLDDLRTPLRYLLGHTKLQKEFVGLAVDNGKVDSTGNLLLTGVPRGMEDRVSKVLLEITPDHQICRISIYSLDGSVTDFRFSEQRTDVAVDDRQFRFVPGPGIEVLQATELQP